MSFIAPAYFYDRIILPNGLPNGIGSIVTLSNNTLSTITYDQFISNFNILTTNSTQTVYGQKNFWTYSGGNWYNNTAVIYSDGSANPGLSFFKSGIDAAQLVYTGAIFNFIDSVSNNFVPVKANGFRKNSLTDDYFLLAGGGHVIKTDFQPAGSYIKNGGQNTTSNNIFLGWTGSELQLTVDATMIGNLWTTNNFNPDLKLNRSGGTMTGLLDLKSGLVLSNSTVSQVWSVYQSSSEIRFYVTGGNYQGDKIKLDETGTIWTANNGDSSQWNQAYLWGNHASAGYATQNWVSTNYIPKTHPVYNITQANIDTWNSFNTTGYAKLDQVQSFTQKQTFTKGIITEYLVTRTNRAKVAEISILAGLFDDQDITIAGKNSVTGEYTYANEYIRIDPEKGKISLANGGYSNSKLTVGGDIYATKYKTPENAPDKVLASNGNLISGGKNVTINQGLLELNVYNAQIDDNFTIPESNMYFIYITFSGANSNKTIRLPGTHLSGVRVKVMNISGVSVNVTDNSNTMEIPSGRYSEFIYSDPIWIVNDANGNCYSL